MLSPRSQPDSHLALRIAPSHAALSLSPSSITYRGSAHQGRLSASLWITMRIACMHLYVPRKFLLSLSGGRLLRGDWLFSACKVYPVPPQSFGYATRW